MIKVLIPSMPTADDLLPYLREIDANLVYVNNGPLVQRLELELSALTRAPCRVASNGTISMELALRAMELPRGSEVLVPAVTYVASGQAIVNAGLAPVLCDVATDSWQLTPEIAEEAMARRPNVRAVMPVAAFGLPVPIEPWEKFTYETNLPVLIDAAGAIYGQQSSGIPEIVVSYSMHATKALGAGEGGVVATCDLLLLDRVAAMANFGPGGTNAKLSEYHAAVALASLKHDPGTWRLDVSKAYCSRLLATVSLQDGAQERRTLFPVLLPAHCEADAVKFELAINGIEAKAWYAPFLQERGEFFDYPKVGPMPVTEMLRQRLLGLPYHRFLTEADIVHVCNTLHGAIA